MSDRLAKLRREVEREQKKAERQKGRSARRRSRGRRIRLGALAVALTAGAGAAVWVATGASLPSRPSANASYPEVSTPGTGAPTPGEPEEAIEPEYGEPQTGEPSEPDNGDNPFATVTPPAPDGQFPPPPDRARQELAGLTVAKNQGSANYQRNAFGPGWGGYGYYPKLPDGCEARDDVLRRDLSDLKAGDRNPCIIFSGVLHDPYTGKELPFSRYAPSEIQIDHVVALGAAWRSGASTWSQERRVEFANDINNMLAVDKEANNDKSSKTPDQWRPRQQFWCPYAERWIGIKDLYRLTVTAPEKAALEEMLNTCPGT
jgi:hypothetical protein